MADRLEGAFARFEASAMPLFQPVPVTALPALTRRRRRVWTGLVAGLLVLAVGGPIGALAVAASPGPDPGPEPVERGPYQVNVPGWELREPPQFGYTPGTIWAFANGRCSEDGCLPGELARSTDGQGRVWEVVTVVGDNRDVDLHVSAAGTVYLRERGDRVSEVMQETGAISLGAELPGPPELLLENGGNLVLQCPGEETYGGPGALACDAPEVADLTSIARPVVPAGMGRLTQIARDGTGRTWLLGAAPDSQEFWLSSSADGGRTWDTPARYETTHLAGVPGTDDRERIRITVSPVDGDAWAVGGSPIRVWKLTHDDQGRIVADGNGTPFGATRPSFIRALGAGVLASATPDDTIWMFQPGEGQMPVVKGFAAVSMDVLADGTLVALDEAGRYAIGAGHGWERTWTHLTP
jgi:hypothetical protein